LSTFIAILSLGADKFWGCRATATELKFMLGGIVACHVLLKLFSHWFVEVKCYVQYLAALPSQATHVKVSNLHTGELR
jgi:hypothetical protein